MKHLVVAFALAIAGVTSASAQDKPLNFLIIWGDDIGVWNISAYNRGMMGYETPNIDRIAKAGMLFTDAYGEQSCTAGRAAFILSTTFPACRAMNLKPTSRPNTAATKRRAWSWASAVR